MNTAQSRIPKVGSSAFRLRLSRLKPELRTSPQETQKTRRLLRRERPAAPDVPRRTLPGGRRKSFPANEGFSALWYRSVFAVLAHLRRCWRHSPASSPYGGQPRAFHESTDLRNRAAIIRKGIRVFSRLLTDTRARLFFFHSFFVIGLVTVDLPYVVAGAVDVLHGQNGRQHGVVLVVVLVEPVSADHVQVPQAL